jgi:hypothetical protein
MSTVRPDEKQDHGAAPAGTFVLEDYLRGLARAEAAQIVSAALQAHPTADAGAEELRSRVARVMAKEFVSVGEAAFLLSCSDGHVRNLVRRAKKGEARVPIPFCDLDGVVVFKLDELLAWSGRPKSGLRAAPAPLPAGGDTGTLAPAPAAAATPGKGQMG